MNLQTGLWQEQTQRLLLTPKLQQSLQVLQYSSLDLLGYLEEQCEQNPVLEWEAADWRRYLDFLRGGSLSTIRQRVSLDPDRSDLEEVTGSAPLESLFESLKLQILSLKLTQSVKRCALFLLGYLDEKGYLTIDIPQIVSDLQVSEETANQALQALQGCEPMGIGARSLRECLLLQVSVRFPNDSLLISLIDKGLTEVGQGKWAKLAKQFQTTVQEIQSAVDRLRTLEPKPGRQFHTEPTLLVLPDIVVSKEGANWKATPFAPASPRIRISTVYEKLMKQDLLDEPLQKFLQEQFQRALWVVRSVEQRQTTLVRVTEAIIELQPEYFDKGPRFMRPMTLKQIAEIVNLHESTIFRTTTGKYAQTPWGVLELKSLFSSGVETETGMGISSRSIQKEMKQLLDEEDSKSPLSDQKLTDLLQLKGFSISRRTVTKYREALGIGTSAMRQRY